MNTYGEAVEASFEVSSAIHTILDTRCNRIFNTDSTDIYIAALLLSFAHTFHDRRVPLVWNQETGRAPSTSDMDISETVGWFATLCPINQEVHRASDFVHILRRVKDRRQSSPRRGMQYLASKLLSPSAVPPSHNDWPFEVIFSYADQQDQFASETGVIEQLNVPGGVLRSRTSDIGPGVKRIAIFEVSVMVDKDSNAHVTLVYNAQSQHKDRIRCWMSNYEHLLVRASSTLWQHPEELTMADVPALDITYQGLQTLNQDRLAILQLSSAHDVDAVYPVTAVQQRMLINQASAPESCHIHAVYELESSSDDKPVDIAVFCDAWQAVVAHYPALRTVFIDSVTETGLYDQVVLRRCSPSMLFIDTTPGGDPVETLTELPSIGTNHPRSVPQHRLALCRSPLRTFVKLDVSSALCDATSLDTIFVDLRRAYALGGKALLAPSLSGLSYRDYLAFLPTVRPYETVRFWRHQLKGQQPCLFPKLARREDEDRFENTRFDLEIPAKELADFARTHRTTSETVLRVAWALILRAFTGNKRVCFGYGMTGRRAPEVSRHAVGCFANTVPCSLDLARDRTLASVLEEADKAHAATLPHQFLSTAEVQHALGMRGDETLFNSCLSFAEEEPAELRSKFTTTTRHNFELRCISVHATPESELAVAARVSDETVTVDITSTILSASLMEGIAHTFGKAVRAVMENTSAVVGDVDLFSDRDYAQIISWGNDVNAPQTPKPNTIHGLVGSRMRRDPAAQAVCAWDGELTYRELDILASRVARHLTEAGVKPKMVVPTVLEKSRWAPVALLAILKAGASFVPMDAEELDLFEPIVEQLDSKKVVVATHAVAPVIGKNFEKVIILNSDLMDNLPPSPSNPPVTTPDDIASVQFLPVSAKTVRATSFTHAAMAAAFEAQGTAACVTSRSRVMQMSPFDMHTALFEVFTTLAQGGCICIPSSAERFRDFTGAVLRMNANWTCMTPNLSRKLDVERLPTLRTVCFQTRTMDADSLKPWAANKKVLFAYGAADICPLGVSFLEVYGASQVNRIGRPILGSLWIVNPEDHGRLMPIGGVGDLVVEGPTLGTGYSKNGENPSPWNVANFNPEKKTRYYKTGHRVRYTESGLVEFVSSGADDLEFNGHVVSLLDVEQQLRRCLGQGIEVLVLPVHLKGENELPALAVFLELGELFEGSDDLMKLSDSMKQRAQVAKKTVQSTLRKSLPEGLMPDIFIPVRALPITPALKINRRYLEKMIQGIPRDQLIALSGPSTSSSNAQPLNLTPLPLTDTEEKMRAVWAQALGCCADKINLADGFIQAGGDEVLAAKVMALCRHEGVAVSLVDLLINRTLSELCRTTVEESQKTLPTPRPEQPWGLSEDSPSSSGATDDTQPLYQALSHNDMFIEKVIAPKVGVEPKAIQDVAEATAMQTRYIESAMLRGRANIEYFTFNFNGAVDQNKLKEACHVLATIHPILRTAFVPHSRRVFQAVLRSWDIPFKRVPCPGWRLASVTEKIIRNDQCSPIAFSRPLTNFLLVDAGKQSTLIVRLSKAQFDDMSVALLVKDLKALYGDCTENPLRRPTFCDFVRSSHIANSQGAEEHWRNLLDGANMTKVVAHSRPYSLSTNTTTLEKEISLRSHSPLGVAFETVLKSAWALVLATLSASSDVVFGEVIEACHFRLGLASGQRITGVMGPTLNTIPVRIRLPDDVALTPLALLHAVQAQRVAAVPFENLGFADIVERCTSWPYWTHFSTVIQHQHEYVAVVPSRPKVFPFGNAQCHFAMQHSRAHDIPDMFVRSVMHSKDRVELSLQFCADRVPEGLAAGALCQLTQMIDLLTGMSAKQPVIPTGTQHQCVHACIPITLPPSPTSDTEEQRVENTLTPGQTGAIELLISKAWSQILNPKKLDVPEEQHRCAAFFDLCSSLIPAAQLATYITEELPNLGIPGLDHGRVSVTMEDIIENPTMETQLELVARKMQQGGVTTPGSAQVGERPKIPRSTVSTGVPGGNHRAAAAPAVSKHKIQSVSVNISSGLRRFANTVSVVARRENMSATPSKLIIPRPVIDDTSLGETLVPVTVVPVTFVPVTVLSSDAPRLPPVALVTKLEKTVSPGGTAARAIGHIHHNISSSSSSSSRSLAGSLTDDTSISSGHNIDTDAEGRNRGSPALPKQRSKSVQPRSTVTRAPNRSTEELEEMLVSPLSVSGEIFSSFPLGKTLVSPLSVCGEIFSSSPLGKMQRSMSSPLRMMRFTTTASPDGGTLGRISPITEASPSVE